MILSLVFNCRNTWETPIHWSREFHGVTWIFLRLSADLTIYDAYPGIDSFGKTKIKVRGYTTKV